MDDLNWPLIEMHNEPQNALAVGIVPRKGILELDKSREMVSCDVGC